MIALVMATAMYGAAYPVIAASVESVSPLSFTGWRFLAAAVIAVSLAFPTRALTWRDAWPGGLLLFAFAATSALALRSMMAGMVAVLVSVGFVIAPWVATALDRRRPSPWLVVASVLAFVGSTLITLPDGFGLSGGEVWVVPAALALALYVNDLRRIATAHQLVPLFGAQYTVAAIAGIVLSIVLGQVHLPSGSEIGALLGAGVGVLVAAMMVQLWARPQIGEARTAAIAALAPGFGVVWSAVFSTAPTTLQWFGAVIVVGSVVIATTRDGDILMAASITPSR